MSNDIANLIWQFAKNDKSLDGLELQQMYKKKIKIDADEQRGNLKKIIADHIKKKLQPINTKIVLDDDQIIGGLANSRKHEIRPNRGTNMTPEKKAKLDENIYAYQANEFRYIEVTNQASQMLIKCAIIPLNLKWKLQNDYNNTSNIEVSWGHWSET